MKSDSTGFTLQDIVLLIGMQGRTGELVVESDNNIGTILFYQGNVLQTSSPYSRAIGDLLVEEGLITDTDLLETLLHQKKSPGTPLGSLLVKADKVAFETIEMKVHEQMRQAVKEFQSWKGITFSFSAKDIRPHDRIHLTAHEFISPETLNSAVSFLLRYARPTQDATLSADPSSCR
jgi:hypothetical protein